MASTSIHGSTLTISVLRAQNVFIDKQNVDIVASVDGVIADIIVFSGTALVTVGDVVRSGDVLVTGNRPTARISISNGQEVICVFNNAVLD
jgi:predicted phage gp36 major capsid-like protein